MLTIWYDDNGEAPQQAVLPLLAYFAAAGHGEEDRLMSWWQRVSSDPPEVYDLLGQLNVEDTGEVFFAKDGRPIPAPNTLKFLVYEDPRENVFTGPTQAEYGDYFEEVYRQLGRVCDPMSPQLRALYTFGINLADYLRNKADLGMDARTAYSQWLEGDGSALEQVTERAKLALTGLVRLWEAHHVLWQGERRPQGFEEMDRRYCQTFGKIWALVRDLDRCLETGEPIEYLTQRHEERVSYFPHGARTFEGIAAGAAIGIL